MPHRIAGFRITPIPLAETGALSGNGGTVTRMDEAEADPVPLVGEQVLGVRGNLAGGVAHA